MQDDPYWLVEDHRGDAGAVRTPPRRACSVRRTTSMEMSYPHGVDGPTSIVGQGRDAFTRVAGTTPAVLAEDRLDAQVSHDGVLERCSSTPAIADTAQWIGRSTLRGFRRAIATPLHDPACAGRPIAQLLDDLVGCSVIAAWVATRWRPPPYPTSAQAVADLQGMTGACISYAPGSPSFSDDRYLRSLHLVPPLQPEDDPHAFHSLQPDTDRTQRRVRRIDVWRGAEGEVHIDAMFQDSGVAPGTRRVAIHEYRVEACARGDDLCLEAVGTTAGKLPHQHCNAAREGLKALLGLPLETLSREVLTRLPGTAGCTHLNDAMRALSAVPALVRQLPV